MKPKYVLVVLLVLLLVALVPSVSAIFDSSSGSTSSVYSFSSDNFCNGAKIGIIGASNVVRGDGSGGWIENLRSQCDSEFIVSATVGYHSKKQYDHNFPKLKEKTNGLKDLDLLIISPSGNNIPNQDKPSYCYQEKIAVDPVEAMAKEAKEAGVQRVVVFNINSRNNKQKDCVVPLNNRLKEVASTNPYIDQVVDIYSLLDDPVNQGTCKYCIADQLHWSKPQGQDLVANEVLNKVLLTSRRSQGSSGKVIRGGVKTTGSPGRVRAYITFTGSQLEKEFDQVWNRISGLVGVFVGKVFYKGTWSDYDSVYGEVPTAGSDHSGASDGMSPTITSGNKWTCNNPDMSKLDSSNFQRCNRYESIFRKYLKESFGNDDDDLLLYIYSKVLQESSCKTGAELKASGSHVADGGIMQVDKACLKEKKCPTVDDQIREGMKVLKSGWDKMSTGGLSDSDTRDLVAFSYNRGNSAGARALKYLGEGMTLYDSMVKACRDFFGNAKTSYGADKCTGKGLGAKYPEKVYQHFENGCKRIGGTVGTPKPSLVASGTIVGLAIAENQKWVSGKWSEKSGSGNARAREYFQVLTSNAKNNDPAKSVWSAAFTSWVMKTAGVADFPVSAGHSSYFRSVRDGNSNSCKTFPISQVDQIQPGDLLCYCRITKNMRDKGVTTCKADYNYQSEFSSHCDVFIKREGTTFTRIGGNVLQGGKDIVAKRTRPWSTIVSQGTYNSVNKVGYYGFIRCAEPNAQKLV